MAIAQQTMTDEQRKSVALEYLKAFDRGGQTSSGGSILDLFADDAQVYFPKWGLASGKDQIGKLFGDVGGTIKAIEHHYAHFNWVFSGSDTLVCEGTSHGEHQGGPWRAGVARVLPGRRGTDRRAPRPQGGPVLRHRTPRRLSPPSRPHRSPRRRPGHPGGSGRFGIEARSDRSTRLGGLATDH